ncbi:MAG: phosphate ABC transporter permease PstA [Deltaproteobacteria bacterium]|nr:phosphate ABC transporter permease PstA [Deltaproteobacteria bacterium]
MFGLTTHLQNKRRKERRVSFLLGCLTLCLVLPIAFIVGVLLFKGLPAICWEFLAADPIRGMTAGGIFPAIIGTIYLVLLSLLFCVPIGVIAAVYLSEYAADNWFTRAINLAIVNLAGVPSIVHALFGLGAFVLFLKFGTSLLAASATLAVMNLPVVITATRESLEAVPRQFREACWNLGATRWQAIRYVVLPNSLPGILTGVIFAVSRAAGETAPILFTGAVFYKAELPQSILDQCMALSMHLFTLSTQVVGVPEAFPYGTALVLVGIVFAVNTLSIALRFYFRTHRKW